MARVLIYPSLDSLEAAEGICHQQIFLSDCTDAQADLSFAGFTSHVGFVVCCFFFVLFFYHFTRKVVFAFNTNCHLS